MTYVQWLGSWLESYPLYEQYDESSVLKMDIELEDAETVLQEIETEQSGGGNE